MTDLPKITSQCDVLHVSHSVFSFPLKYKVGKTNFFITVVMIRQDPGKSKHGRSSGASWPGDETLTGANV